MHLQVLKFQEKFYEKQFDRLLHQSFCLSLYLNIEHLAHKFPFYFVHLLIFIVEVKLFKQTLSNISIRRKLSAHIDYVQPIL